MEIKVCTTTEWTERDWATYVIGFNEVFEKDYSVSYFQKKYTTVTGGCAFHALLLNDVFEVVGGCTVLPCLYKRKSETFLNGLAVDVFIREEYRVDPLMLRRMYSQLRKLLDIKGVVAVMAVPNATAYPYWVNVVKWKDVGCISYWVLPVRLGNVLHKLKFVNLFSIVYAYIVTGFSSLLALNNARAKEFTYLIHGEDGFIKHRYDGDYKVFQYNKSFYAYRLVEEEGIKTAYLLEATNDGYRSFRVFVQAVKAILKERVDIVLYVGKIGFFQTLFLKVPRKMEPKLLPLTCDLISKDEKYTDIYTMDYWDFGLKNYDVR